MARLSVLEALTGSLDPQRSGPQQPLGPPVSPEQIKARRRLADALMEKGMDTSPIGHWTQGMARVMQSLSGAIQRGRADADERAGIEEAGKLSGNLLSGGYGGGSAPSWNTSAATPKSTSSGRPISAPEDAKTLIAQHVPEEMRDYMTRLIGKESGFRSDAVSPTGATGYVQFTKGTGSRYGLVGEGGDMRKDPVLNLQAAVRFTNDNRNGLRKALGREPTWGEVALAHQQGLGGALNLLSGKSVAPGNLAVNNVDPNSDPRAAAQKIMAYYDMPGGSPDPGISADPGGVPNRDPRMMVASTDPNIVPSPQRTQPDYLPGDWDKPSQGGSSGFTEDELASLKKQGILADNATTSSVTPQGGPAEPTTPGKIMGHDGGHPNGGPPKSRATDDTRRGANSPVMNALVQYGPNPAGRSSGFAPVIAGNSPVTRALVGGPSAPRGAPAAPAAGASGFAASPGAPMAHAAPGGPQGGAQPMQPMDQPSSQGGGMSPRMQQAAAVLSHPYSTPEQKAMAEMIYKQEMERGQPRPVEVGGRIVDANTGRVIYDAPQTPSYDYREVNGRIVQIDKATGRTSDITPQNMPSGYRPATQEELTAYGVAPGTPVVIGPDGKPQILSGGGTNVNVDLGGGSDKQVFDEMKARTDVVRSTITGLQGIQEANKAVQAGGIFGAGANERLGLQKVAALLGIGDTSKIQNTETFRSAIAPQVAAMIKATVGSANISNTDREFAEKAAGGDITLDPGSLKRLMRIMDRMGRDIVSRHQRNLDDVYPDSQDGKFKRERALFGVTMPAELPAEPLGPEMPAVPQAAAPQPQAAPGGAPTPSPRAVELLRSNPAYAEQFDQRYGPGAAQRALGGTVGPSSTGGGF